ncbi:LacI family DNA-binding transcriptional regulator [Novosphingobium sp. ERN07]|uniref:LacI family DNA-binding transcriptional regulator n=1 Tax=Novosphingobium sp. ERN07 TaxID=2726187 RepID=UPI0021069C26|nr:LacI family DNA-binding transcriptional regulator [Novosphingobium sp. ERN07]
MLSETGDLAKSPRRKSQAITIETVARVAGVSAMTVSNVLNNSKPVREATREAVMRAVRDLNYTPNLAAKALAGADTTRIGLLLSRDDFSFISSVLGGAVEATSALGAQLMTRRLGHQSHDEVLAAAQDVVVAGANALVLPGLYAGILQEELRNGLIDVPVVAASVGDEIEGIWSIRIDDEAAAYDMTTSLIALGHRRVGFLRAEEKHLVHKTRFAGYARALAEAGLALDPSLVVTSPLSFDSGIAAADAFLDRTDRPTAIFASNDDTASAIVAMAHKRGLRVPDDLSVAGFDDSPLALRMWPRLSSVRQPVTEIARKATELAISLARLSGETPAHRTDIIDHTIVMRESTAPLAEGLVCA